MLRARTPALSATLSPSSPIRERERDKERARERESEKEGGRERESEKERVRERGRERERVAGALAPFSYLVIYGVW